MAAVAATALSALLVRWTESFGVVPIEKTLTASPGLRISLRNLPAVSSSKSTRLRMLRETSQSSANSTGDWNGDQIGVDANYLRFGVGRRFLLRRFLRVLFGLLLFRLRRRLFLRLAIESPLARRLSGRSHREYEAGSDRKNSQRFQTPEISNPIHKSIRLLSLPSVNFRGIPPEENNSRIGPKRQRVVSPSSELTTRRLYCRFIEAWRLIVPRRSNSDCPTGYG